MVSMNGNDLLSTANLADGCMSAGVPFAVADSLRPLRPGDRIEGTALPVRHCGSVDVFLEAIERSSPGDVLVVDNQGRDDEGCVGDLTAAEAAAAGIAGLVIWGRHRDTAELRGAGIPIFSLGCCPAGPRRLDARPPNALGMAICENHLVTAGDFVVADDDGVIFIALDHFAAAADAARGIRRTELKHVQLMRRGRTLREQLDWKGYARARATNADFTFREHLRKQGGAIEI